MDWLFLLTEGLGGAGMLDPWGGWGWRSGHDCGPHTLEFSVLASWGACEGNPLLASLSVCRRQLLPACHACPAVAALTAPTHCLHAPSTDGTTTQADGECTDEKWALDIVTDVASSIQLDPALLELISCKPNPDFVSSNRFSTSSSSTVQLRRQLLQEEGSCTNPAYLLELGVVLDPTLDAEEYRCGHSVMHVQAGDGFGVVWCGAAFYSSLIDPSPAPNRTWPSCVWT